MSNESKNSPEGGRFNFGTFLVYSASFVIVIAGLQAAASILVPVLLAVFIAIVLTPAYFVLQRHMNPTISLTVLIFGLIVASFGMVALVKNSIDDFTANKDTYIDNLTEHSKSITGLIKKFTGKQGDAEKNTAAEGKGDQNTDKPKNDSESTNGTSPSDLTVTNLVVSNLPPTLSEGTNSIAEGDTQKNKLLQESDPDLAGQLQKFLTDNSQAILDYAGAAAGTVGALLGNTFLIVMIAIFLLLEAAFLPKKIRNLPGMNDETWDRLTAAVAGVRHYTELKTLLSLLTGFLCWLMLVILGVEYAILFGLLAFILNYVPNIGSLIAAVPAVLIAWLGSPAETAVTQALIVTAGYITINTVIGNVLEPKILDKGLGLSASIIVVTMVFWGWVLGPVGMLLSVPLTMIAKIALEASNDTQWIGAMMGSGEEDDGGQVEVPKTDSN